MGEKVFTTEAPRGPSPRGEPTRAVIGAAMVVHTELGPGLLESAYSMCLAMELDALGVAYEREVAIPLRFRGRTIPVAYRADFVVEGRLLLEIKSVKAIEPVHRAQVLTYLKLTGIRIGLLLNFNASSLRNGIVRLAR